MSKEIKLAIPFEIKRLDDEDGIIEGYAATFDIDLGGDRIVPGAFKSLRGKKRIPMLWQHYSDEAIGVWTDFAEDKNGLVVRGELNLSRRSGQADVPMAWKAMALAKQGAVTGLSIGFYAVDFRYEGDIRILEKVDVIETSLATFPMNPLAQVVDVKNMTNKEFVQATRELMGLSRQAAEALRAGGFEALREYVGTSRKSSNDDDDDNGNSGQSGATACVESAQRILNIMKG